MGAHRKLDPIAIEQIVAARGAGRSYRQIGASLGVSHSTVSRLVASDPVLRARIRVEEKREERRARDRERKRRAKARREAGREASAGPGHEQRSLTAFSPDGEDEPWERVPEVAFQATHASHQWDATARMATTPPKLGRGADASIV